MKPNILLVTNGYEGTRPAIEYAAWLAGAMQSPLTLMGVVEDTDEQHPLEELFSEAVSVLKKNNVAYTLEVYEGQAEERIGERVRQGDSHLLIFGPLGRSQLRRWALGRSFRAILEEVEIPMLYVPATRIPLKKILICVGGLGYEITAEHLAIKVAVMNQAEITFLNVVPPVDLEYPETRKVLENLAHLEDTDTLSGRALRQGLDAARQAGIKAAVRVRQGNVVEQILSEIKLEAYDLICMGSPYSVHGLRHLYMPNVTAEVAESAHLPVLTVRFSAEK
jgi:nucleotide-binding universal stress UspA family protein